MPVISNVKYNEYLKVVAQAAGIDKPVSSHWARHTGATLLLNEGGMDLKTVAKICGHTSFKITEQVYANMLDDTVVEKMAAYEKKLKYSIRSAQEERNSLKSSIFAFFQCLLSLFCEEICNFVPLI